MPLTGVIFLGGGHGKRLNGVVKPLLTLEGKTLLDYSLQALDDSVGHTRTIAVTAPDHRLPPGMPQTLEDPPFGGPVAGISVGLTYLYPNKNYPDTGCERIAIFTGDAPLAPLLLPRLLSHATERDGAICQWDGRLNYLIGVYDVTALARALPENPHGCSARKVLGALDLAIVTDDEHFSADIDIPDDICRVQRLIHTHLGTRSANT
ncbi:molybdenum cofactor guanylyltransferase [Arcanobacterium buesumense]|uniref:NTP transferase domain-containing protein n=1 Tax=Arcanobacterium buesumense TaxID=2722751 RepID=A0A6H2EMA7_9ACTO|nr:NTP transferase domain-containing protein [Arcanobacterium buesumense]QJC22192.1 NTP transferase domain-containing protein [Arcanobacterium buesumense]